LKTFTHLRNLGLASGLLLSLGISAVAAQDTANLTIGGISGDEARWVNESVIPACSAQLAEAGMPVTIEVLDSGNVSGEDQRQQLVLDMSVGEGPDITSFDGFWLPEFVDAGLLTPLNQLVGPEVDEWEGWTQIPGELQNIMGYDGNVYGIPRGTDLRAIWVNRSILEQAGLAEDWQPTSWAELLDGARAIRDNVEGVTPLNIFAGNSSGEATTLQGYLMLLLGTGEHIYDFDQQKWIVGSQGILDVLNMYATIYGDEALGDQRWQLVQNGRDLSFEAFANGTVGMLVEGDYLWRSVLVPETGVFPMASRNDDVGFVMMPAMEPGSGYNGQDFVTISGGTGFVINPNTDSPAAAWGFLSCMFSAEQLTALQAIQPRIRARADVPVTGDETMSALVDQLLALTTIRPQLPEYNQVSEQARLMTERVVSGEMTPEEAMAAYATAVAGIVGEENTVDLLAE
jgi:multiple sugar transport system substrate-binding protein